MGEQSVGVGDHFQACGGRDDRANKGEQIMREISPEKLNEILKEHRQWLEGDGGGERANLRDADLRDANLLRADLRDADLRDANLRGADLRGADLWDANLLRADLRDANLLRADLRGADLRDANLLRADLRDADLRDAELRGADLRGVNLVCVGLPPTANCPEEGGFVGFKKLSDGTICKLWIPDESRRVSPIIGRKCRAEFVDVLEGEGETTPYVGPRTKYKLGQRVYADKFDDDIRVECSHGIHFFITRKEAEQW